MPRAPSEKREEAEKLFRKGMKLTDIAKKLDVSEGTVRSWKSRGKWEDKTSKKNKCNAANNKKEKNATLQKKKRGGQPGNKNAKGGKGNPNPVPPPDMTKHGAYSKVYWDTLDEDELSIIEGIPQDEEDLLMEQIQLFAIRERRIMKAINKYRNQNGDVAVADVTRFDEKRGFKDKDEEAEYERRQQKKIDEEKILPGKSYSVQTHTTNKDLLIARLEQELSTVQSKKTKAIEALSKIRMENKKLENESAGNAVVDDWIAAVIGCGGENDE